VLDRISLHSCADHVPAVAFLDVTWYTRLTQERGDDAAAELAAMVGRLVCRTSIEQGGKPSNGWATARCSTSPTRPGRLGHAGDAQRPRCGRPAARPRRIHAGPVLF
jgi:hypothetical protein